MSCLANSPYETGFWISSNGRISLFGPTKSCASLSASISTATFVCVVRKQSMPIMAGVLTSSASAIGNAQRVRSYASCGFSAKN